MFTIPNGSAAEHISQAQVDAVDIEIMVEALTGTGVVDGCAVTAQTVPNMTVAVAAGDVAVAGVTVGVGGGNVTILPSDMVNARFDLVCVDAAGTKSVVQGTAAVVPQFPDPGSKVVLAAVRVPATITQITSGKITDKRAVPVLSTGQVVTADIANGAVTAAKLNSVTGTGNTVVLSASPTLTGIVAAPTFNAGTGFQVAGVALAASNLSNGTTGTGAVVLSASPTFTGTVTFPGGSGSVVQIGTAGGGIATPTPALISLDSTYGNTTAGRNFKLLLFNDGTASDRTGFGVIAGGSIEYSAPADHIFYKNAATPAETFRIAASGVITATNAINSSTEITARNGSAQSVQIGYTGGKAGITFAGGTQLYEQAAGDLRTTGSFFAPADIYSQGAVGFYHQPTSATGYMLAVLVSGDTDNRMRMDINGYMNYGPGNTTVDADWGRLAQGIVGTTHSVSIGSGVTVSSLSNGSLAMKNTSAPGGTPAGGGILYVVAGALKYIGTSGTVTTIAVA